MLLLLSNDKNTRVYQQSRSSLNAVRDFKLIFGLYLSKVISLNTGASSRYIQGKNVGVVNSQKTSNFVNAVFKRCQNKESLNLI